MGEALTAGAGRWHGPDTAEGPSAGSDQTAVPHESVGSRDGCPTNQAGIPALQVACGTAAADKGRAWLSQTGEHAVPLRMYDAEYC